MKCGRGEKKWVDHHHHHRMGVFVGLYGCVLFASRKSIQNFVVCFFRGFFQIQIQMFVFRNVVVVVFSAKRRELLASIFLCVCVCFKQQKFKFFPLSLSPQRQFDNEMNELRWWWSSSSSDIGE